MVAKDANINIVVVAAKCITGLAKGLRKDFAKFALMVSAVLFCYAMCVECAYIALNRPLQVHGAVDGAVQREEAEHRGRDARGM